MTRITIPILVALLVSGNVSATEPKIGDKFIFKNWKDQTFSWTYEGNGVYRRGKRRKKLNEDGNLIWTKIKNLTTSFNPHNGALPPGEKFQLKLGQSWDHDFTIESNSGSIERTRSCEITKVGPFTFKQKSYEKAFKIVCNNQRAERENPREEVRWYDPSLSQLAVYNETDSVDLDTPRTSWLQRIKRKRSATAINEVEAGTIDLSKFKVSISLLDRWQVQQNNDRGNRVIVVLRDSKGEANTTFLANYTVVDKYKGRYKNADDWVENRMARILLKRYTAGYDYTVQRKKTEEVVLVDGV
jgi:hypothetical protein